MQHEYCTQTLPFGCERRGMVLRRSVAESAKRTGLATPPRPARGLQRAALAGSDRRPVADAAA